jgi:hypothetical protein
MDFPDRLISNWSIENRLRDQMPPQGGYNLTAENDILTMEMAEAFLGMTGKLDCHRTSSGKTGINFRKRHKLPPYAE